MPESAPSTVENVVTLLRSARCMHCGELAFEGQSAMSSPAVSDQEAEDWRAYLRYADYRRRAERIEEPRRELGEVLSAMHRAKAELDLRTRDEEAARAESERVQASMLNRRTTRDEAHAKARTAVAAVDESRAAVARLEQQRAKLQSTIDEFANATQDRDSIESAGAAAEERLTATLLSTLAQLFESTNARAWANELISMRDGQGWDWKEKCLSLLGYRRAFGITDPVSVIGDIEYGSDRYRLANAAREGNFFPSERYARHHS